MIEFLKNVYGDKVDDISICSKKLDALSQEKLNEIYKRWEECGFLEYLPTHEQKIEAAFAMEQMATFIMADNMCIITEEELSAIHKPSIADFAFPMITRIIRGIGPNIFDFTIFLSYYSIFHMEEELMWLASNFPKLENKVFDTTVEICLLMSTMIEKKFLQPKRTFDEIKLEVRGKEYVRITKAIKKMWNNEGND